MDDLINETARKHNVDPDLIRGLLAVEQSKVHLRKRRGAKDELRQLVEKHIEETEK